MAELKEPSFLKKLKSEYGGDSLRHERPLARPKRLRADDGEDDEPVYVDEENHNTMSKAEYEAMMEQPTGTGKESANPQSTEVNAATKKLDDGELHGAAESGKSTAQDNMVDIGGGHKKRKMAKVIGDLDEPEAEDVPRITKSGSNKKIKHKKKAKMKLSFDDEVESKP